MTDDAAVVFHGFLNLKTREKMELVEAINEYFDSTKREPIREANEQRFVQLWVGSEVVCRCCGKGI